MQATLSGTADGFCEWRRARGFKQAFHFGMRDGSVFALAGTWDRWQSAEGTKIESCAILTTQANALMAEVHDRMPVILKEDENARWLTPAPLCPGLSQRLFVPFDADRMRRFPVSPAVNDVRNDTAECLREIPEFISRQVSLF